MIYKALIATAGKVQNGNVFTVECLRNIAVQDPAKYEFNEDTGELFATISFIGGTVALDEASITKSEPETVKPILDHTATPAPSDIAKPANQSKKPPVIVVTSKNTGELFEIPTGTSFYWFEENFVEDWKGDGLDSFKLELFVDGKLVYSNEE